MKVKIEFEVELHRTGDTIRSGIRTKASSLGVPADRILTDGVLLELKPAFESLALGVHDAVLRRVASVVHGSTILETSVPSLWRTYPPTVEEVREYPWWWHRMPNGDFHILHLEIKIGTDIIIDVEESAAHDCGGTFDPDAWPGEWAACTPPYRAPAP